MSVRCNTNRGANGCSERAAIARGADGPSREHGHELLRLALAGRRLVARFEERLRRHDLNLTQLAVLECVAANEYPVCNADIAEQTAISQGALSVGVETLIRRGLLCTFRHDADGRKKMLVPTDEGEHILHIALADCLNGFDGARRQKIAQDLLLVHLVDRVVSA